MFFQPLHAEELGQNRLTELGTRATPPTIAGQWISGGLVGSHRVGWRTLHPASTRATELARMDMHLPVDFDPFLLLGGPLGRFADRLHSSPMLEVG